jgi:protein TonB
MRRALMIGLLLTLFFALMPTFINKIYGMSAAVSGSDILPDVRTVELHPTVAPPKTIAPKPKIKTIAAVVPIVVETPKVEYVPPTNTELQTAAIANVTQEGEEIIANVPQPIEVVEAPPAPVDVPIVSETLIFAEVMPTYGKGSDDALRYIYKNVVYPSIARDNGVEGKVTAQFVINEEGKVTNVKILRGIGAGCDEEVLRVLTNMPSWSPGYQGKRPVRVRITVPVTFKLER